jgi:hypothetical protein
VRGAVSKIFGLKSVDDRADGFKVYSAVELGSENVSGKITNDSETL